MQKSLLCAVLVASACWRGSAPEPSKPIVRAKPACTEGGERLLLRTCRRGDDLVWTITNNSDATLWAFVAPRGTKQPTLSYANVLARIHGGHVVLSKLARESLGGERALIGALELVPGAHADGVVPVGTRIDPAAEHITGAEIRGSATIASVALEIGFAEKQATDRTIATKPEPLVLVVSFDAARQEVVRAPPMAW